MRYVLLFSDGTITLGAVDDDSSYTVWARRGWRQGVTELARRVNRRHHGKITNLEIQSHGEQGKIVVDHHHDIDHRSVANFGAMLRPIMAPGGLIEILACLVAGVAYHTPQEGPSQYSPEIADAYWGAYLKDPVFLNRQNKMERITDPQRVAGYSSTVNKSKASFLRHEGNGLEFCLTLARTSGAIVRAASIVQVEELSHTNSFDNDDTPFPISRDYDRFGEWEGHVWDFTPDGKVNYLGCNLPRHSVRFPKAQIGPQLTYNARGQGGRDTDVGQRQQRLSHNPLPV